MSAAADCLSRQRMCRSSRLTSRNLGEPVNNRPFTPLTRINQLRKSSSAASQLIKPTKSITYRLLSRPVSLSINLQRFAMTRPCWTMSATGDWSRAARRSTAPLLCRGRLAGAHEGSHDPAIDSLTSSIALARDDAPTLSNQTVSK